MKKKIKPFLIWVLLFFVIPIFTGGFIGILWANKQISYMSNQLKTPEPVIVLKPMVLLQATDGVDYKNNNISIQDQLTDLNEKLDAFNRLKAEMNESNLKDWWFTQIEPLSKSLGLNTEVREQDPVYARYLLEKQELKDLYQWWKKEKNELVTNQIIKEDEPLNVVIPKTPESVNF